jgi:conserved hypothetical protein
LATLKIGTIKDIIYGNIWKIIAIAMLISLAFSTDFAKILDALSTADLELAAIASVPSLLNMVMWSVAWRRMFSLTDVKLRIRDMFRVYCSSRFVNLITPLGHFGGAPIMAIVVSENTEPDYGTALSAILTSNILISFPLLLSATTGYTYLYFTGVLTDQMNKLFLGLLFIIAFGTSSLMLGLISPSKFERLVDLVLKPIRFIDTILGHSNLAGKVGTFRNNVLDAFEDFRGNEKVVMSSAALISIAFLSRILSLHIIMTSLGIELSVFVIALIIPLSSLANYAPTPGGTGFVESAIVGLILIFSSISASSALVAAVLYRAATYYLEICVGYFTMSTLDSEDIRGKARSKAT